MSAEPRLLFLFLDGVGLGSDDAAVNPFAAAETPALEHLLGGKLTASLPEQARAHLVFRRLDASLGVSGLPQSATGQTTLLTGKNGALRMGRHYGPWPGPTLKNLLDEGTLFSEARSSGGAAGLANVYPPGYFQALEGRARRVNAPVYAALAAGLPLLTLQEYGAGTGASVDLSGRYLGRMLPEADDLTPEGQGRRLAGMAQKNAFTFFDFWPTDDAGHRGGFSEAVRLVEGLDGLLSGVLGTLGEATLLLTSDHGNLEDKTTRGHTFAPVPLLALGPGAIAFAEATTILDVAPSVRRVLGLEVAGVKGLG